MNSRSERITWFDGNEPQGWGTLLGVGFCSLLFLFASYIVSGVLSGINIPLGPELVLLGLAALLLTVFVLLHNERLWIYSTVLAHGLVLIYNREGIGFNQVLFIVYVQGGMVLWFVKEMLVYRRRLVQTGFDGLLLSVFILASVISLIAFQFHDSASDPLARRDALVGIKEWTLFADLLIYFPMRKILQTRRDVQILLGVFLLLAIGNGIINILTYRSRLVSAIYAYQILTSRTTANAPISTALAVFGAAMVGYARTRRNTMLGLAQLGAGILFTIISFSRAYILTLGVMLLLMMLMAPRRSSLRLFVAVILALLAGATFLYAMFPAILDTIGQTIIRRLLTAAKGTADISLSSRAFETRALLEVWIPASPILGHGFGAGFTFADPLSRVTSQPIFIHNGYIWPLYKFGIPVSILLYLLLVYPFLRLLELRPRRMRTFEHAIMTGAVVYMVGALTINFTSNQFMVFDGVFNLALSWALLDYVHRRVLPNRPGPAIQVLEQRRPE
jgi:hypothetical protein